jgi:O-methyltransferase
MDKLVKVRDKRFRRAADDITGEGRTKLGQDRLWVLWQAVRNVAGLQLPAAEVGTYRGGSAAFIARAYADLAGRVPPIDVVDTFEGHPAEKLTAEDADAHVPGLFGDTSFEEVRDYLSRHPEVRVHKGEFSAVAGELTEPRYGLAHVDVDLYEPTLDCLRFFSERIPPGGAIVLDDYEARKCPGIKRAAEQFLEQTDAGFHTWNPLTEQLVLVRIT